MMQQPHSDEVTCAAGRIERGPGLEVKPGSALSSTLDAAQERPSTLRAAAVQGGWVHAVHGEGPFV